jgi:hypothetical protein
MKIQHLYIKVYKKHRKESKLMEAKTRTEVPEAVVLKAKEGLSDAEFKPRSAEGFSRMSERTDLALFPKGGGKLTPV